MFYFQQDGLLFLSFQLLGLIYFLILSFQQTARPIFLPKTLSQIRLCLSLFHWCLLSEMKTCQNMLYSTFPQCHITTFCLQFTTNSVLCCQTRETKTTAWPHYRLLKMWSLLMTAGQLYTFETHTWWSSESLPLPQLEWVRAPK